MGGERHASLSDQTAATEECIARGTMLGYMQHAPVDDAPTAASIGTGDLEAAAAANAHTKPIEGEARLTDTQRLQMINLDAARNATDKPGRVQRNGMFLSSNSMNFQSARAQTMSRIPRANAREH